MKKWKVIVVLLALVVLLSVILGFKILNNTPEKQIHNIKAQYNQENESEIGNITLLLIITCIVEFAGIVYIIMIRPIGYYKLYKELGINDK